MLHRHPFSVATGSSLSYDLHRFQPGFRKFDLPFPIYLFYPAIAAPQPQRFGPYTFEAALDAEDVAPGAPLVLISHRVEASPWEHRDLAINLARCGYRVALAEYPAAREFKEKRIAYIPSLLARPGEIQIILDLLESNSVVLLGHSVGATPLLSLVGGFYPPGNATGHADPRVRALVLLVPSTSWYQKPGALARVRIPMLMITAEHDAHIPPATWELLQRELPPSTPFQHYMVPGANHGSLQSPDPEPATTHGFDRAAFQPILAGRIDSFLRPYIFFPFASSAKS